MNDNEVSIEKIIKDNDEVTEVIQEFEIEEEINHLIIEDTKNIEFYGTEEQKVAMFKDYSLYYSEITNPENTTKNTMLGGAMYAPLNSVLNTVRPILGKYGLTIIQTPYMMDDKVKVKTIMIHRDGAIMSFPSSEAKLTKLNNAVTEIQSFGLYCTYLRRFSLNAIAGVAGEIDNDGNDINNKEKPKELTKKEPTKEELELKNIQELILKSASECIENGIDKELVYQIIADNNNNKKNPNSIKDLNIAKKVLEEIKNLKKEKVEVNG